MANEIKLPYVRFVRRCQSLNKSIVQWKSTMAETLEALKVAPWVESSYDLNNISMPVNAPLTFQPSEQYDTYKMSSTVAASGKQICYMGMVAYRYEIPPDAITNSKYVTNVLLSVGADKFCTSGLRVALYLSNDSVPPTDWTTCREGTQYIPDETIDLVTLGILASRELLVKDSKNSYGDYTVTFDPAPSANYSYLYIIVSNYNYADFRASREYYIEGSGLLSGDIVQVGFASAVTQVVLTPDFNVYNSPYEDFQAVSGGSTAKSTFFIDGIRFAGVDSIYNGKSQSWISAFSRSWYEESIEGYSHPTERLERYMGGVVINNNNIEMCSCYGYFFAGVNPKTMLSYFKLPFALKNFKPDGFLLRATVYCGYKYPLEGWEAPVAGSDEIHVKNRIKDEYLLKKDFWLGNLKKLNVNGGAEVDVQCISTFVIERDYTALEEIPISFTPEKGFLWGVICFSVEKIVPEYFDDISNLTEPGIYEYGVQLSTEEGVTDDNSIANLLLGV